MRTTKISPTECPICDGMGYAPESADVMRMTYDSTQRANFEVGTIRKGTGCPFCLGTGQVSEEERVIGLKQVRGHEVRTIS